MALKDWRKLSHPPSVLDEGDSFFGVWENAGWFVFITGERGGFVVGTRGASQMSVPEVVGKAKTLSKATIIAKKFMAVN